MVGWSQGWLDGPRDGCACRSAVCLEHPSLGTGPVLCACFSRALESPYSSSSSPGDGSAVQGGEASSLHVQQARPKCFRRQELGASHTQPDSRGSAHFPELCSRHGCKVGFFQYSLANFRKFQNNLIFPWDRMECILPALFTSCCAWLDDRGQHFWATTSFSNWLMLNILLQKHSCWPSVMGYTLLLAKF